MGEQLELINLTDIGRVYGMSPSAVWWHTRKPDFPKPCVKIGYMPLYHWPDVRAYFQAHPPRHLKGSSCDQN